MNNLQIKEWAGQTVRNMVSLQLSDRSKVDILKAAALTETLLGFFRGYRDNVFNMHFDFDEAVEKLEAQAGYKLSKGQRKKVQDMLTAQLRELLKNFKEFEAILSGQLKMLGTLDEKKQEVLNQVDEQIYEEQELMRAIYDTVIRDGKKMVNINQLRKKIAA